MAGAAERAAGQGGADGSRRDYDHHPGHHPATPAVPVPVRGLPGRRDRCSGLGPFLGRAGLRLLAGIGVLVHLLVLPD